MDTLKQQRTKKEIIDAMKQLLGRENFSDITVKQVCETAMIHHSTFYRYFLDKYDLLQAVLGIICDDINILLNAGQTVGDATFEIVKREENIFRHLNDYQRESSFYSDFLNGLSGLITEYATKDKSVSHDALLEIVKRSKNPELASYTAAGAILGIIAKWNDEVTPVSNETLHTFLDDSYTQLTVYSDVISKKSADN